MLYLAGFPPIRVPYALRHVPLDDLTLVRPAVKRPYAGDLALARVRKIGKNTRFELSGGRNSALSEGDLVAVVFGHRYATAQFEGYAEIEGDGCDLLSMAGVCGIVRSKASAINEPTKLDVLGMFADPGGKTLNLNRYALKPVGLKRPKCVAVLGSSMDAGKTHTAGCIVRGLAGIGAKVAAIKLTGTAAGRDTWSFADAGADPALDFVDGGWPSTYLCSLRELLKLREALVDRTAQLGAEWTVIEVADGLLQRETAMLIESEEFRSGIDAWLFATGDPLAAMAGVEILRKRSIEPSAISGLISTRPLAMREAFEATRVPVLTDAQLQEGSFLDLTHKSTKFGYAVVDAKAA